MQSAHHGFKQLLAAVLSTSLIFSIVPPPSRAATEAAHAAAAPWHLMRLSRSKQGKPLGVNSASLAISQVPGNSVGVRGVGTQHSEKKTVVSVDAANATKLRTRSIGAKSTVNPSLVGTAKMPGARPLAFIENKGQFNERVKYQVPGSGQTLWLTDSGIVFDFAGGKSTQTSGQLSEAQPGKVDPNTLRIGGTPRVEKPAIREAERQVIYQEFVEANRDFAVETEDVQQGAYNYLTGSDPSKWQTHILGFSQIVYHDIWKGVDLRLYGKGPDLEQEFIVKPGANVSRVRLSYQGIDRLEVAKDGSLLIRTGTGQMRETAPQIYQSIAGRRIPVAGRFKLLTATSYTFEVYSYDAKYALVIDPTLLYSTFLGGSAGNDLFGTGTHETATGIAVDTSGNAYVTGFTASTDFPTTPGAFRTSSGGGQQTFVTKLDPTGSALVYSSYLNAPLPVAISVDASGNAYVTGSNAGNGFPTTPNAYSQSCNGSGFLTVLNSSGSGLIYSTCFSGAGSPTSGAAGPVVKALAVDANGRGFIAGYTNNPAFPTTGNAYQGNYPGSLTSGFVTEFDTTVSGTSSLVYSTYLGIVGPTDGAHPGTTASAIGLDSFGKIYLTGFAAPGFPVTPGAYQSNAAPCIPNGSICAASTTAFVAKLDPSASGPQSLIYATYFGGMGHTATSAIAVDASGAAYLTGSTDRYSSFPVTPGAFQTTAGQNISGASFVTKFNAAGSQLVYSTLVSDLRSSSGNGIAVDSLGNAYIAGQVNGSTFPVTTDAFQSTSGKGTDFASAFLAKLNPAGSALVYSSYLGGTGDDVGTAVAVDLVGDAYVAGHTSSADFPIRVAFQPTMHGTGDAFVSKFSTGAGGDLSILGVFPSQGGNSGTITPTIIGSGFHYGATATLSCAGAPNIVGTNVVVSSDGRTISATFSLVGQAPGSCSVTIANADGTTVSRQTALTVQQGGSEDVQLDLFGRSGIRGGILTTYDAGFINRGSVDSRPFRMWISFPNYFAWSPPPDRTPSSTGQLNGTTYVAFDVPSVPAGSSGWIPIQLVAPSTPDFAHRAFTVQAWRADE
jgi:hypothetical protein